LLKYDQAFGTRARPWEAANHSGGPAWAGHCWGWSVASILVAQPQAAAKDGIVFNRDELEGLCSELGDCGVSVEHPNSLTMFDPKTQDGSLWPPPTDALGEPADPFCARFHVCLRDGIRRRRSALQSNLRDPRGTDPEQVWNHAIYRYSSRFVNDDGDPDEVIRHETTVTYNDDLRPPPTPDGPGRTWRYVYKIRYDPTTGEIEPNWPQANWMRSGGRFAPSHLFFLRNSIWTAKNPYVRRDFLAELSIPIP
jgi:hypothetical protein